MAKRRPNGSPVRPKVRQQMAGRPGNRPWRAGGVGVARRRHSWHTRQRLLGRLQSAAASAAPAP
eukprot:scaffold104220_cov60-Phaeocystis_antarctica.AAC.1